MAASDPGTQHQAVLQIRLLEKLSTSIDKLGTTLANVGRGGGSSGAGGARGSASILDQARKGASDLFGGRAFGGGAAGLAAAGVASAGVAAAAIAAPVIAGGLVQANRGGSFSAGAVGAATSLAAGVPLFGELSGASAVERVTQGATSDMNAATNDVARFSPGAVTPRVRDFLARQAIQQNVNVEADRQANSVAINEQQYGRGVAGVLEQSRTINHMVVAAGYLQHQ